MRSKINVMHIRTTLGRYGPERGLAVLAKDIEQYGYTLFVTLLVELAHDRKFCSALARQCRFLPERVVTFYKWDPRIIANVCAAIHKLDIRLLHTHDVRSDLVGFIISRLTGLPLVTTMHGYTRRNVMLRSAEICDKILLKLFFDKVVVVSRSSLADMRHVHPEKVVTILSIAAMDDTSCRSSGEIMDDQFLPRTDSLTVGVFGRLSPEKGFDLFLRAFALLHREFPTLRALVVGDGPLAAKLRKLAAELEIAEKVIFTGFREDARSIMKGVDVVVVPSLRESYCLAVQEALLLNKAVVAADVGDISMIARGCENVQVVAAGSIEALKYAMAALLARKLKGEPLISNGRRKIEERSSAQRMVQEHARLYTSMLSNISGKEVR